MERFWKPAVGVSIGFRTGDIHPGTSISARTSTSWLAAAYAGAQQPAEQASPAAFTDVYHVHFVKAVPGKTTELERTLLAPSVETPMPTHVLVLRHREGDDWDFASIAHEGASYTVKASDRAAY